MPTTAWLPKPWPWLPSDYSDDVVMAVRQLADGKANEAQQKLAWRWLMYVTAASDEFQDLSFRPGGEDGRRATDFADGKRFVGMQVKKLLRPELTPKPIETSPASLSVQKRLRSRRTDVAPSRTRGKSKAST
jgi:hypothetical protein